LLTALRKSTRLSNADLPQPVGARNVDAAAFLRRLREHGLYLHVDSLWQFEANLDTGFFLSEQPRAWDTLNALARDPRYHDRWQGIIKAERRSEGSPHAVAQIQEWGPYGLLAGPFVLFGDPVLLARVREAVQD
jgi:hypothetical protein